MTDHYLWPATDGPVTDSATEPISLGVEFDVTAPAWLVGFRCWRASAGDTGVVVAAFHVATEAALAGSTTAVPDGGTGWRAVTIDPIALTPGVRYVATAHHPVRYPGTAGYWMPGQPGDGGQTHGPLHAPDNAAVLAAPLGQGRFLLGPSIAAPTQTYQGGGYWITPVVTDVDPGGATGTAALALAIDLYAGGARRGTGTGALPLAVAVGSTGHRGAPGTLAAAVTTTCSAGGTKHAHGLAALTVGPTLHAVGGAARSGGAHAAAGVDSTAAGRSGHHGSAGAVAAIALAAAGHAVGEPGIAHHVRVGAPTTRWRCDPPTT